MIELQFSQNEKRIENNSYRLNTIKSIIRKTAFKVNKPPFYKI